MPVFKKKRNVSFAAVEKIDEELDRLEKTGILSKVISSEWDSPTVYVRKKSNQIRICADFSTGLNAVLKNYHYPLPTPEEVFNKCWCCIFQTGLERCLSSDPCRGGVFKTPVYQHPQGPL